MEQSRMRNSIRNIIFGCIHRMVSIIFPFIVRTIFISSMGEGYLGLNSLFASILQVLNVADLGFSNAIIASMYKPIADNDIDKVSALMGLYRRIYKVIGGCILITGILLTPFLHRLINGKPPAGLNIYLLWILYLVNTVISYLLFAYKISIINAHQRNDVSEMIGTICRVIVSVLQIYTVAYLKSIYLYVLLTIVCTVSYNLWCAYVCDKWYPQYSCSGGLDLETKRAISKNVVALAFQKIGNTVSVSFDAIVISAFLGLNVVAIYGNYHYIISAISICVNLIYVAITASIGNSIAVETREKNYSDFKRFVFLNTWLVGWCSICFMCLFQDFMVIWMGKDRLFSLSILLSLVLRFFFDQLRKIVLTYKDAAGMWWMDKWRPIAGCSVNLILNIVLVRKIGVAGVAISTIISYACVEHPWETHILFKNYFKLHENEYYRELLVSICGLLLVGIPTYLICDRIFIYGIVGLAVKLGICIAVPNVLYVALNLRNPFFIETKKMTRKIHTVILYKSKRRNDPRS